MKSIARCFLHCVFFVSPVLLFSVCCQATEFPWLKDANTQVLLFEDPRVDIATRIAAIRNAKHSIENVTYGQGVGPLVGLPLLKAFRFAHDRGVEGKHIYDRVGSFVEDKGNKAWMYLADSGLTAPPQVIDFGGFKNYRYGLNLTDMVHLKITIIDGGTPDEIIFLGGRNYTESELTNLDLSIAIRRIDPSKPYLGDQIRAIYSEVWEEVSQLYKPRKPLPLGFLVPGQDDPQRDIIQLLDTEKTRQDFATVQTLLARKPQPGEPLEPFEARPQQARAVTNSFFALLRTGIFGRSFSDRKNLYSEIHESIAPYIEQAKSVYLSSMILFLSPTLKVAVKKALQNDAEVTTYVNSSQAHKSRSPWGVSYVQSVPDLLELMNVKGKFYAIALDLQKAKEYSSHYLFSHRKMLLADHFAAIGSDNFNDTSRTRNYEFTAQFLDERFATQLRGIFVNDQRLHSAMSCENILTQKKQFSWFIRGLNWLLRPLY